MHHKIHWIKLLVWSSIGFSSMLNTIYAQNPDSIFGNNTLKFQIYEKLIEHEGSLNQLVKDYNDSDSLTSSLKEKTTKYSLDTNLTLIIQANLKKVIIENRGSLLLKVNDKKNKLIVIDKYNRLQKITFYSKSNNIQKIKIYSIISNKLICIISIKKNQKKCKKEGRMETSVLDAGIRKEYQNLYNLYNLTLFD
jgi:hypothetical protein